MKVVRRYWIDVLLFYLPTKAAVVILIQWTSAQELNKVGAHLFQRPKFFSIFENFSFFVLKMRRSSKASENTLILVILGQIWNFLIDVINHEIRLIATLKMFSSKEWNLPSVETVFMALNFFVQPSIPLKFSRVSVILDWESRNFKNFVDFPKDFFPKVKLPSLEPVSRMCSLETFSSYLVEHRWLLKYQSLWVESTKFLSNFVEKKTIVTVVVLAPTKNGIHSIIGNFPSKKRRMKSFSSLRNWNH